MNRSMSICCCCGTPSRLPIPTSSIRYTACAWLSGLLAEKTRPSIQRIKSLPAVFSRAEVKKLIATPKWKKHRILFALIYSAGLRIIAISNHRIKKVAGSRVTFSYKNYRKKGKKEHMQLAQWEFIRRFAMHMIPHRFVRIPPAL